MFPHRKPLVEPQCEQLSAGSIGAVLPRRLRQPVAVTDAWDALSITDLHMLRGGALSARRRMFDEGQSFENTSASMAAAGELSSSLNPALTEHS